MKIDLTECKRLIDEKTYLLVMTNEKYREKFLWRNLFSLLKESIPAGDGPIEWLGLRIEQVVYDVVHPVTFFGNIRDKKFGKLTDISIRRYDDECIHMLMFPTVNGGASFICSSSSDDFSSLIRFLTKSYFD